MAKIMLWSMSIFSAAIFQLFILLCNVTIAFNLEAVYMYAVNSFPVSLNTGLDFYQLNVVMNEIRIYLHSSEELITTVVSINGVTEPLFTYPEALHFKDVRDLLDKIYLLEWCFGLFLFIYFMACLTRSLKRNDLYFQKLWVAMINMYKSFLWVSIIGGIGFAFGAFDLIFYWFHVLVFSNDLWMGLPSDRMILLFPSTYFLHITILIWIISLIEIAVILFVIKRISLRIYSLFNN